MKIHLKNDTELLKGYSDMIGNTWKCLKNQMSWNIYQLYTSWNGSPTWKDLSLICLVKEKKNIESHTASLTATRDIDWYFRMTHV